VGVVVQSLDITLSLRYSSLLWSSTLCWGACYQSLFLLFGLSIVALVLVLVVHINDGSIFFSSVKYSNHEGGGCTRRKFEFLADDDLPSQGHSKNDTEEADAHGPDYKLDKRKMDTSTFTLGLAGLEQVLESRDDADEATSQRHSSY